MGGNIKHGFRRGNASGRNGAGVPGKWFCTACQKEHGGRTERTGYQGGDYCSRTYYRLKEQEFAAARAIAQGA